MKSAPVSSDELIRRIKRSDINKLKRLRDAAGVAALEKETIKRELAFDRTVREMKVSYKV